MDVSYDGETVEESEFIGWAFDEASVVSNESIYRISIYPLNCAYTLSLFFLKPNSRQMAHINLLLEYTGRFSSLLPSSSSSISPMSCHYLCISINEKNMHLYNVNID